MIYDFNCLYHSSMVWANGNTRWLGVPIQKYPTDMLILQEIIWDVKPDLIIETGTAAGGSALFFASILDSLGKGQVITIDIDAAAGHPPHERISYVRGCFSVSPEPRTCELGALPQGGEDLLGVARLEGDLLDDALLRRGEAAVGADPKTVLKCPHSRSPADNDARQEDVPQDRIQSLARLGGRAYNAGRGEGAMEEPKPAENQNHEEKAKPSRFPFGMNPTDQQIESAIGGLAKVYFGIPETTCSHRCECCKAGSPNMYFLEFLAIRRKHVDRMPKEKRLDLTIDCVRYYVKGGGERPCLFLGADGMCRIYDWRQLKCRLYGLIPPTLYEWVVGAVAKENRTKREDLPLCRQCDQVRIKPECLKPGQEASFPGGKVPEEEIRGMERKIRDLDLSLGMSPALQERGHGFLTYHDWHLLFELGPEWMEKLSVVRTKFSAGQKEEFVLALKDALSAALKSSATKKIESQIDAG